MSVATFDNTMAELTIELSDREIYNDVRSSIDITESTEKIGDGTDADYGARVLSSHPTLTAGETKTITLSVRSGDTNITWDRAWCSYSAPQVVYDLSQSECTGGGGNWFAPYDPSYPLYSHSSCYYPANADKITVAILSRTSTNITLRVVNTSSLTSEATINASYSYLAQAAIQGPITVETETRTLLVRATDDTSINKYGRRVMNLTWPLGQSEEQMQSLVDGYVARYKNAVTIATMKIQGHTDALVVQILIRKISEVITAINTELGLSADFYINAVSVSHNADGILEAIWQLEEVRAAEKLGFFTLGTSVLGGTDILGW